MQNRQNNGMENFIFFSNGFKIRNGKKWVYMIGYGKFIKPNIIHILSTNQPIINNYVLNKFKYFSQYSDVDYSVDYLFKRLIL